MIDIIAGISEIAAKIVVGQKSQWGWLMHLVGGILWTIIAFQTKLYGLLIITIPAFFVNLYNFWKWSKEK